MPQTLSIISYISSPRKIVKKGKKFFRELNQVFVGSLVLTLLTAACFGFYLYMNLELVEMNFKIREEEEALADVEDEIKQLDSRVGNSLSIEELEKKVQELKLTRADDIRYMKVKVTPSLSLGENLEKR